MEMGTNRIGMMLALAGVAITCASLSSAVTVASSTLAFAVGQKARGGNPLSGTSWRLVKFQAPDESSHTPDDKSKYTITFGSNGRVTARVDCNRASSTWKATAKSELQFGSWSRTNAKCGPGSLHDQIVNEGANVRKFAIKDGHLFLSAAGGYYELEPMR
jgi:heat shock protein HslJ